MAASAHGREVHLGKWLEGWASQIDQNRCCSSVEARVGQMRVVCVVPETVSGPAVRSKWWQRRTSWSRMRKKTITPVRIPVEGEAVADQPVGQIPRTSKDVVPIGGVQMSMSTPGCGGCVVFNNSTPMGWWGSRWQHAGVGGGSTGDCKVLTPLWPMRNCVKHQWCVSSANYVLTCRCYAYAWPCGIWQVVVKG